MQTSQSAMIMQQCPPGLSVQDGGRGGFAALGLPASGPLDPHAHAAANILLGNPPNAPAIEIVILGEGPLITCRGGGLIALSGADFGAMVDGRPLPSWHTAWLRDGETLQFPTRTNKQRHGVAYLAVSGGLHLPSYLGSTSAYLGAANALPQLAGRYLASGDVLPFGKRGQPQQAGHAWPFAESMYNLQTAPQQTATLDIIWTSHAANIGRKAKTAMLTQSWQVGESNRMGTRLMGKPLNYNIAAEIISFGVVRGAVQLPPGGLPIILGPDHQTTGGYPLIAVVAQASWPTLGQLLTGDTLRVRATSLTQAKLLLKVQQAQLAEAAALLGY